MAVTDSYATVAEYKLGLGLQSNQHDAAITTDLAATSRHIERRMGRFFTQDAAAVKRVFVVGQEGCWHEGGNLLHLPVDLSADPTTIKRDEDTDGSFTDETAFGATDYELRPINAALGPEAEPYTALYLPPWTNESAWANGQRVEIDGQWGWAAVPSAVKQACIQLTAILRMEGPRATRVVNVGIERLEEVSPEARSIVSRLIADYSRPVPF